MFPTDAEAANIEVVEGSFAFERRIPRPALLVLFLVLTLAFEFRYQIGNGFSVLLSGRYDGTIQVAILEHWYNVLRGIDHWDTTSYFYPYKGTLGYNDGYFFYGVVYGVFRVLGSDPFLSSELVNITMKGIGFVSFFFLMRRVFLLGFGWSAFGAVIF